MGLTAFGGRIPPGDDDVIQRRLHQRKHTNEPRDLLSGPAARRPIAFAQAYLAMGAAVMGTLATLLPHPESFNVPALLAIQAGAALWAAFVYFNASRLPFVVLRLGAAIATAMTTAAVYFSGDSTSGFVMLYVWVGLYSFYFPLGRLDATMNVLWAAANYAFAIAITPNPAESANANVHHYVITAGTLVTAGVLLTYLRTRVERLMGRLTDAARTDPLTNLPNRVAMQETLERELARARPEQRPVSLAAIDLDRFSRANDRLGIKAGDEIIRATGSVLKESTRLIDTVARSGGEEFVVVMPETDQHRAFLMAEDLLRRLREYYDSLDLELTASVGVATFPAHATDITPLIASCNKALQAAKALGRDRVVIYSPEVTQTLGALAGKHNVESQAQLATVLSLAEALDQRDSSTARHSQTVGALCELMAQELGLDEDRVERVRLAGILHDIGKIGVPDSILGKPGPLTEEETAHMRRHPELGSRILSSKELDDVRGWVLAHHERPDGNGYPKGLKGDQIPVEASILAVADAFEAMTSDRVYRDSLGEDAARRELIAGAGTQFNADVVDALLTALKRESPISAR